MNKMRHTCTCLGATFISMGSKPSQHLGSQTELDFVLFNLRHRGDVDDLFKLNFSSVGSWKILGWIKWDIHMILYNYVASTFSSEFGNKSDFTAKYRHLHDAMSQL